MANLAVSKEFMAAYALLPRPVRRAVDAAIGKFAEHTHAGLHLERLQGARDARIRTIRINSFYRGVVLALNGQDHVLHTVLPHDDAIAYAVSRVFTVNQILGVLEVRDQVRLDEFAASAPAPATGMFDRVGNADLTRMGIDPDLLPLIRGLVSEAQLQSLAKVLPDVQFNVLAGFASGFTAKEVWDELAVQIIDNIDVNDLGAAARHTPEKYHFVSGPVELAAILARPFDVWRTFLHPTQRDVAYRPVYHGPALITGSAGTGKTVTGLHRAVFLARRLPDDGSQVLLTTFTRTLADRLGQQLVTLTDEPKVRARIEVRSVDRLANQIVKAGTGRKVNIAEEALLHRLWASASRDAGISATFLRREWEQVILAQRLTTWPSYRDAPRRGQGSLRGSLADGRERIWAAVGQVVGELQRQNFRTYLQLADDAANLLGGSTFGNFRHLVVDEGQDLHPAQWRLLRALVPPGPNDLFLLADPHQRIYDSQVSLTSLGIETRGRARRLTVNYRTTHEILDWSVRVLGATPPAGLDDADDSLSGYRSVTRGQPPVLAAHADRAAEHEALIERVGTWLEQGVEAHAIGIAARTNQLVDAITTILRQAHIPVAEETTGEAGVLVATMHRMKGLEFQCLAVVGLDAATLPAINAITTAAEDPLSHRQDLQRERCLLFVAVTRARDVLYLSHTGAPSPLLPALRENP